MKKLLRTPLGHTLILASLSLWVTPALAQTKIGAFTRGTGATQYEAQAFEQGIQIALKEKSQPALSVQYLEASAGSSPESTTLKSLVESTQVPLLIYWKMDDVTPVGTYLTQSEVIALVSGEVTKKIARLGNHVFGFGYSTELSTQGLAKFAGNTLKAYRFGLISSSESRFDTQSKAFSEQTKSLGNTVVFDEKVDPTTASFTTLIARAKSEKCDSIFAALPASDQIQLIKAARAGSYKGNIFVNDTLFAPEVAALGSDAEGIYMMQSWSDDPNFKALYTAQFSQNIDGVTLGAVALGYDAINCIRSAGEPLDSSSIKYSFLAEPCEGLTGKTQFSGERIALRKKRVVTVKNGQFTLVE